jgi:chitosanase
MVFNHKQTKFFVASDAKSRCVVGVSLLVAMAVSVSSCDHQSGNKPEPPTTVNPATVFPTLTSVKPLPAGVGLSESAKPRADQLISLFENSTLAISYDYIANLDDGRGYTAGRAGFTSATGDLVIVVRRYVAAVPTSPLARFLPELERLAAKRSAEVTRLNDFTTVWEAEANQAAMREAQDATVDELYYRPAMIRAAASGLRLPLALAAIYDTAIQHGEGNDPDGLPAMLTEATAAVGPPGNSVDAQTAWLRAFLKIRRAHLSHAHDPATRVAWAESVGRVDTLVDLLDRGIVNLDTSFAVKVYGDDFTVP